jgi:hypothetical protein
MKALTVLGHDNGAAIAEVNAFLSAHRVLAMNSCRSAPIASGRSASASRADQTWLQAIGGKRPKVDYRGELSQADAGCGCSMFLSAPSGPMCKIPAGIPFASWRPACTRLWRLEQQCARGEPQGERPGQHHRFPVCPSSRVDGCPLPNKASSRPGLFLSGGVAKRSGSRRAGRVGGCLPEGSPVGDLWLEDT